MATVEEKSKSQLKKESRLAELAAKKAAKEASGVKVVEEFRSDRLRQIDAFGINAAYPHKWPVDILLPEFRATYGAREFNEEAKFESAITHFVAGRVLTLRASGKDLAFFDLHADEAKIQVILQRPLWNEELITTAAASTGSSVSPMVSFDAFLSAAKRGDIVGFVGFPGVSKTGELSLYATGARVLSACYHMLPKAGQLTDEETRKRQRYLDMIVNPHVRRGFYVRSFIIKYVREFLDAHGFLEVETPILNAIAGGAAARPFKTHHNELDMQMFMRIAPELYLKQLIVGGMDRVYEIGRQFRNEGIDATHNPEFTTCEFYWAYKDYNDLMSFTENMLEGMVRRRNLDPRITPADHPHHGTTLVEYRGNVLNFEAPFPRISLMETIEKNIGAIPRPYDSPEAAAFLEAKCRELKLEFPAPWTVTRMIDNLAELYVEPNCVQPTFVIDHPVVMTPLAKWNRRDDELTERFELFVGKKELINAYTELNSPQIQRERFQAQSADRAQGDDEAPPPDESFCTALEYALPPTAGWGMGIDRLAMFLSGSDKIAEVILFPTLRPEEGGRVAAASAVAGAAGPAQ